MAPPGSRGGVRIALATLSGACAISIAGPAVAGTEACGSIRIEAQAECEVRHGEACAQACDAAGYEAACAAQLKSACDSSCPPPVSGACDIDCDAVCEQQCDDGIVVVCAHNCFEECTTICPQTCAGADDPVACAAACSATCDQECTLRCDALAQSASCYDHCKECCGGACAARGMMGCQVSCQSSGWSACNGAQSDACAASCERDGAVICDEQFVAGGNAVQACTAALWADGIEVDDSSEIIVLDPAPWGCTTAPGHRSPTPWWLLLTLLGLARRPRGGKATR